MSLQFGYPLTTYDLFLTAGPSHELATIGSLQIDAFTKDADGVGKRTIAVPVEDLRSIGGAGYHTDHLDAQARKSLTSFFVAGALNYFVPQGTSPAATRVTPGDPTRR